jgi:nitrogen fixation/metabolism regulation signal transduction histidine kinase
MAADPLSDGTGEGHRGATLRRLRVLGAVPVAALVIGLFVALVLMRDAVENSEELSRAFVPLLFLVLGGLAALAVLVVVNVVKLVRRYRGQAAGSRLTLRIVVLFVLISLLPVGVVYYFSLGFLLRGIDSWFDVEIDRAMQDALDLNQASLDLNQRVLVKYTEQLLASVQDRSSTAIALSLGSLRRQAGAEELTVYGEGGRVLGTANQDPLRLVPSQPEREVQQEVRFGSNYVGLEAGAGGDLRIRVLVHDPGGRPMQMQALFPTSERIGQLSGRLEDAYNRYTELAYLRQSLKLSFSLTLSLVLLFGLMAALIAAFHTARRLVAPVADIARGTRAIATGDYEQQLPLPKHDDELAFLVASFNTMTRRIAQARDAAARSQQAVEAQRAYLETVLGRLSSGVVAFDDGQRLRTANPAARQILGLDLAADAGPDLDAIESANPVLTPWVETVRRHLAGADDWRTELTLHRADGAQTLMCRGSALPLPGIEERGHVVVFDDITTLITAQRDAAWGEVARRLAHEIKNPLTPIQLSAERLRHKLLPKADEKDAQVLDRATRTITQQVEAMKSMVNDFSEYARTPKIQAEPLVLDRLVAEVMDLYKSAGQGAVSVLLGAPGARVRGDPLRLRQVIHNLVKNALEALEGRPDGRVEVSTSRPDDPDLEIVQLKVADNGPGFDEAIRERVFEPYVTSKAKGTGLGLAIVKKIIEEHGGMIAAENTGAGALIRIRLPVWRSAAPEASAPGARARTPTAAGSARPVPASNESSGGHSRP